MQLWDFLLSWGIHLNIICIIAQLHSIRSELMSHARCVLFLFAFINVCLLRFSCLGLFRSSFLNCLFLYFFLSPMKLLRIFPDLDADRIIGETIRMIKLLPDELYDLLVRHPYDPSVAEQIAW